MSGTNFNRNETPTVDATEVWLNRLSICLPLVFLIGAPAVIITRIVYFHYYPSEFVNTSPTISGTASQPPADYLFEICMMPVVACIFIAWTLNLLRNTRRLAHTKRSGISILGPTILNWLSCTAGICAGVFLGLVAIYNLRQGHDVHMFGSWAFYISQSFSIVFDILFVLWMRKLTVDSGMEKSDFWARVAVASGVFVGSFFFLYMYETKDYAPPQTQYTIQLIYIASEYVVCLLFLLYPAIAYREMRRHFAQLAAWHPES